MSVTPTERALLEDVDQDELSEVQRAAIRATVDVLDRAEIPDESGEFDDESGDVDDL